VMIPHAGLCTVHLLNHELEQFVKVAEVWAEYSLCNTLSTIACPSQLYREDLVDTLSAIVVCSVRGADWLTYHRRLSHSTNQHVVARCNTLRCFSATPNTYQCVYDRALR
jgi:hypothetical protein